MVILPLFKDFHSKGTQNSAWENSCNSRNPFIHVQRISLYCFAFSLVLPRCYLKLKVSASIKTKFINSPVQCYYRQKLRFFLLLYKILRWGSPVSWLRFHFVSNQTHYNTYLAMFGFIVSLLTFVQHYIVVLFIFRQKLSVPTVPT